MKSSNVGAWEKYIKSIRGFTLDSRLTKIFREMDLIAPKTKNGLFDKRTKIYKEYINRLGKVENVRKLRRNNTLPQL